MWTAPLSRIAQERIATAGLLVFGLTGFVDVAIGRPFSWIKGVFLVLGILSALGLFLRKDHTPDA